MSIDAMLGSEREARMVAARLREIQRRGLGPKSGLVSASGREWEHLNGAKVPLTVDGMIDEGSPVHCELAEALAEAEATPLGSAREQALADVFRAAVLARHWDIAIRLLSPGLTEFPFSDAHLAIYRWWHSLDDRRPRPLVVCVNRGGGKTTSLELIAGFVGMEGVRNYVLYVHARKEKAADSVSNIADLLTRPIVRRAFPEAGAPYKAASGTERDWRKERVRTASGFTIDALGMDQALRGAKVEDDRPGLIILDDLESEDDTPYITKKKEENVTKSIIPTLARNGGVAFVENMIHADSMMAKIVDGRADYLTTRDLVGPIPQVVGLEWVDLPPDRRGPDGRRYKITHGTASWEGQDVEASEEELNDIGLAAFLSEKQHDTEAGAGDKFDADDWVIEPRSAVPSKWVKVCRAWDLAGSESEDADWTVGALVGLAHDGRLWVLDVVRGQWNTATVIAKIVTHGHEDYAALRRFGYMAVVETQIGTAKDHWERELRKAAGRLPTFWQKPTGNKSDRADLYASKQQSREVVLVASEWNGAWIREHRWFPDGKNDDQVDAGAHAQRWLSGAPRRPGSMKTPAKKRVNTPL